uniref:Uncharacterized protein n=1 Tax=Lepeophtheirus salmonis TaxID=72036 RepID=A0A0K2VDZ1_LEPSM
MTPFVNAPIVGIDDAMPTDKLNQGVQFSFRKIKEILPPPKYNSWEY